VWLDDPRDSQWRAEGPMGTVPRSSRGFPVGKETGRAEHQNQADRKRSQHP
jgi:hypothetical protein